MDTSQSTASHEDTYIFFKVFLYEENKIFSTVLLEATFSHVHSRAINYKDALHNLYQYLKFASSYSFLLTSSSTLATHLPKGKVLGSCTALPPLALWFMVSRRNFDCECFRHLHLNFHLFIQKLQSKRAHCPLDSQFTQKATGDTYTCSYTVSNHLITE